MAENEGAAEGGTEEYGGDQDAEAPATGDDAGGTQDDSDAAEGE